MMACAVECYPPTVLPTCTYLQEAPMFIETGPWLQLHSANTQVYPIPANRSSITTRSTLENSCGVAPRPQNKPSASPSPLAQAPAWWESAISADVHKTLRTRECKLGELYMRSPQLHRRRELVEYVSLVCKHAKISTGTRFLAVRLMDYFMDGHAVMDYRLKLVALTSLLVAAKFEEPDDHLPTIETLQQAAQFGRPDYYTREEFKAMEIYLLRVFKWSVSHPTAAHFTDYYLHQSLKEDLYSAMDDWECQALKLQMKQYCAFFVENTLREEEYLHYKPSQLAAAAVCATRVFCQFHNAWGTKLQEITSYSLEDLSPIVSSLLRLQHHDTAPH